MSPPPEDDRHADGERHVDVDEFDPSSRHTDTPGEYEEESTGAARGQSSDGPAETTSESVRRFLDDILPAADVDSKWWYWVAAVPLYFVLTGLFGVVAVTAFGGAFFLDILGTAGVATMSTMLVFMLVGGVVGLVGVAIAVLFPVAMYVDARALEALDREWQPDPVVYGLVAAVGVVATNFLVSVPLALYYLYRRHETVGTP